MIYDKHTLHADMINFMILRTEHQRLGTIFCQRNKKKLQEENLDKMDIISARIKAARREYNVGLAPGQ